MAAAASSILSLCDEKNSNCSYNDPNRSAVISTKRVV